MNDWPTDPAWVCVGSSRLEDVAIELTRSIQQRETKTSEVWLGQSVRNCDPQVGSVTWSLSALTRSQSVLSPAVWKRSLSANTPLEFEVLNVTSLNNDSDQRAKTETWKDLHYTRTHKTTQCSDVTSPDVWNECFLRSVKLGNQEAEW